MEITDLFISTDPAAETAEAETAKAFRQVLAVVIYDFLSENKEEILLRAKAEIARVRSEAAKEETSGQ